MAGKYREFQTSRTMTTKDYQRIHPVWRGVGFAMMVLIPIISYAAQDLLVKSGKVPIPADMYAMPGQMLFNLIPDPLLYIRMMYFFAVLAILFAILTLFSFMVNSMFGISQRKDPFYVPPIQRRKRRR